VTDHPDPSLSRGGNRLTELRPFLAVPTWALTREVCLIPFYYFLLSCQSQNIRSGFG